MDDIPNDNLIYFLEDKVHTLESRLNDLEMKFQEVEYMARDGYEKSKRLNSYVSILGKAQKESISED